MAKLKIGSGGIKIEAQLPKLDPIPKIGLPDMLQKLEEMQKALIPTPTIDLQKLAEKVKDLLPRPEVLEKTDLSNLCTKNEMAEVVIKLYAQRDELELKVEELSKLLYEYKNQLVVPEVKYITQVKDLSVESLEEFHHFIRKSEEKIETNILKLQNKLEKQNNYFIILGLGLVLTIFFHLI